MTLLAILLRLFGWNSDVRFTKRCKVFLLMYRIISRTQPIVVSLRFAFIAAMLTADQILRLFADLEQQYEADKGSE